MLVFRLLLILILASLSVYTAVVIAGHGINLLPIFFGDIRAMTWPGQFNFDFLSMLTLSAAWVVWRNRFSPAGYMLAVLALFGGALFLSSYLLWLSFRCRDVASVLTGHNRGPA